MTLSPSSSSFDLLDPRVQRWIWSRGWMELRDIQENAIREILQGDRDVLIAAATASGKTEAAFLPLCSKVVSGNGEGLRILYISPLKALINDQWRRLDDLCETLEIEVHRWHGDVSATAKRKLIERPRGILLITPESLEGLLINRAYQLGRVFEHLDGIVIDEVHAFFGSERGMQLQSQLHRLELITERRIRRIGLSATLGDLSLAADYLRRGESHRVAILESAAGAEIQLQVRGYLSQPSEEDEPDAEVEPITEHLFRTLRGRSNLVFANQKSLVETVTDALRRKCEAERLPQEFWAHHGNLSKDLREEVELMLKEGSRPLTVVCTSTLELGIDIGAVASVAQISSPPSVSSLRQRLGRSGRRGEPSVMRIYVQEAELTGQSEASDRLREDLVRTVAMVELLRERWCEVPVSCRIHGSTLFQQLLSIVAQRGGVRARDAYRILCESGPFDGIGVDLFIELLRELGHREILMQGEGELLYLAPKGEKIVEHYSFYAAFASEEQYRVISKGRELGTLPSSKLPEPGGFLIFAGRRWLVVHVDHDQHSVIIDPAPAGRAPIFQSGPPMIEDGVARKMKHVYSSSDSPSYLNPAAAELLAQGRKAFREMNLDRRTVFSRGAGVDVYPWRGTRSLLALAALLKARGIRCQPGGISMSVQGADLDTVRSCASEIVALARPKADELAIATGAPVVQEKFDVWLPQSLAASSYASRSFDLDGAYEILAQIQAEPEAPRIDQ